MNAEQKARIESNRQRALEKLKNRGIIRDDQAKKIESRNAPRPEPTPLRLPEIQKVIENRTKAQKLFAHHQQNLRDASLSANPSIELDRESSRKRPLDKIRPTVRKEDYIEYDLATMKNSHGGFINVDEVPDGPDSKKQQTFEEWQKAQQERRALYEEAQPPEHPSLAPKCIECSINTELDPLLHDVFKLQVCKACVKTHPEKFSLLTKTECKEDYFLTDPELNDDALFYRFEKPNPHSGTFARMQLFVRCQVEAFSYKKWGGEEGLDGEWQRREEGRAQRREKKYKDKMKEMRIKTRAQEYTRKLLDRKHGKEHVHDFSAAIDGGVNEEGIHMVKRRCIGCGLESQEIAL
ncbi:LANO_0A02542g1_1 [Lachancea nothofagi CBS 11611]|uniref:LANO_0A02542g1_1 n=1 Tax=Lachancea nothofagi CBS 11611 TaxID=1266666 RepID=A0A1G4INR6_9SACH|nr:LANO_0A02542g1_1 [Lachancea nothofagi CBS 11611]